MEENFNNQKSTMKESKTKEPDIKMKRKKAKVAVITLSIIIALFLGLQVYASVNGYGNVFFMIKNLITTGNPAGKQEIFSDKDITLSYKSIELAEGLKIQANRLEIKDGKTKIFLSVKSQNRELLPLKYETTINSNDGKSTTTKIITTGKKPENIDYFDYEDIIELPYEVKENDIIILKISDSKDKELRILEINLETREITVKGENEFEKISEIELKKYLSVFSQLINGAPKADTLLYMACRFQGNHDEYMKKEDFEQAKNSLTDREFKNKIIKEFYGENAEFENTKNAQGKDVDVLKGLQGWKYDKEDDSYQALTAGEDYHYGRCLKIEDASYENEIYTIKYVYMLLTDNDQMEANIKDNLEELPQYETTIKLKRYENNLYSKYQVINIEKGTEVKNKVNIDINDNTEIKQSLAGAWYTIDLYNNNEIKIKFTNNDFDKMFGNTYVDKTKSYAINGINGKVSKMYQANNGTGVDPMTFFLLEDGTVQYILPFEQMINGMPDTFRIDGQINNVKNVVDLKTVDSDVVRAVLKNGEEIKIWNEWMEWDEEGNTEVSDNITDNEESVNRHDGCDEKYFNKEIVAKWQEIWSNWAELTCKIPENFVQTDNKRDDGKVTAVATGNIKEEIYSGHYKDVEVKIEFENAYNEQLPAEFSSNPYYFRIIKSTDNNGWSNWRKIEHTYSNNMQKLIYGRARNNQIQKATFEFKGISGIGPFEYTFAETVLETVRSKT